MKYEVHGLELPEVETGDDLASLILESSPRCDGLRDGDVVLVTSKIVSKSAGLLIDRDEVEVSDRARRIARANGADPRIMQIVLDHSDEVLLSIPILDLEREGRIHLENLSEDRASARTALHGTPAVLVTQRNGQVYTDAGLDTSNHPTGVVSIPPADPNKAARDLRLALRDVAGVDVAVVVTDTELCLAGGTIDVARGASGFRVIDHGMGDPDRFGHPKFGGIDNVAQELAAAAALLMGQNDRGIPVVVIRGVTWIPDETGRIEGGLARSPGDLGALVRTVLRNTLRTLGLGNLLHLLRSGSGKRRESRR